MNNRTLFILAVLITIYIVRKIIHIKKINKLCRMSFDNIYEHLYKLEIGLANGEIIELFATSDYDNHSCESFIKHCGAFTENYTTYWLDYEGANITIIKDHISFERISKLR